MLDFVPNNLSVIDIGCSSGEYLDAMPAGWQKHGYEVNPVLLNHLKSTRPDYLIFENLKEVNRKFNLVTLRGVIEHIPNHDGLLNFLERNLSDEGIVFISATPDFSRPGAVISGASWGQIVAPEHIHQFTPASLQILLSKVGLVMKSLQHPYLGTPYANWEEDKLAFLKNLEGLDLKTTGAKQSFIKHPFPGNMMSVVFQRILL